MGKQARAWNAWLCLFIALYVLLGAARYLSATRNFDLIGGAIFGGSIQAGELPRPDGPAFDAIREQVPEGASAIVVVSDAQRVAAMGEALTGAPDALESYQLNPAADAELQSALAQSPPSTGANRPAVR